MENWIESIIDELVSLHISKQICSNPSYQNKRKQIVLLHEAIEDLLRSIDDNGVTAPTTFVTLRSGGFLFKAGYGQIPQAIPGRPPVLFARIRA